jgi:alkanesulfonate monooxygenase SsuD/methylene tetrahydromethanopterin reductase-like flavin-dependent oxidoreductase (luciferase family)
MSQIVVQDEEARPRTGNTKNSAAKPYPPLSDEPELIKFVRVDATHYPGEYAPKSYDPMLAKRVYEEVIEEAVEAEALGWDGFFFTEHHYDAYSLAPSPNLLATAIAMKTSRMRLGSGVYILPAYDPVRLAEEVGMLDVISGGRFEVGLGRGNFQFEVDRFTAPAEESIARFDENLDVFTRAIQEESFTYDGRWTKVRKPSTIYPRPVQSSVPIWIGASSPGTVEKVARLGCNLAGFAYPDGGERLERFVEVSRKAGRIVNGAHFMGLTPLFVAPTDAEAEKIVSSVAAQMEPFVTKRAVLGSPTPPLSGEALIKISVFGSPRTIFDKLVHILGGCGARRLMAVLRFRGINTETVRQTQTLFAKEVAPKLRTWKAKVEVTRAAV